VAAFLVGLVVKKAPPSAAKRAMLLGLPLYGFCRFGGNLWPAESVPAWLAAFHGWAFLHHMGLVFLALVAYMLLVTWRDPLEKPAEMPVSKVDVAVHPQVYLLGSLIIAATTALYLLFW